MKKTLIAAALVALASTATMAQGAVQGYPQGICRLGHRAR